MDAPLGGNKARLGNLDRVGLQWGQGGEYAELWGALKLLGILESRGIGHRGVGHGVGVGNIVWNRCCIDVR